MTTDRRTARLERRLERESRARAEAEQIAEHGMRELWLANRDLEERVRERTVDLERSLLAARQASAAKESFLADLGHGLATPLHAVLGHLELIDRAALGPADRDRIETASRNAEQLASLLRGLVDLAGAEGAAGHDEIETRAPSSWLDDVADTWGRAAAGRGQLLVPVCRASSIRVATAWLRLRKIVDLLLDNALVHAHPGPLGVELEITPAAEGSAGGEAVVMCRVVDQGPGLDAGQIATVLEPFVRFGDTGGLGVGLAQAHRLARAAEGSVVVANTGPGTEATVTLPAMIMAESD